MSESDAEVETDSSAAAGALARRRGEHNAVRPRSRQGVVDKRSASALELHRIARSLKEAALGSSPAAALSCIVGGLTGLHPGSQSFRLLPLDPRDPVRMEAGVAVCFGGGATAIDLDLLVERAARPDFPGRLRLASRMAIRPLPAFAARALERLPATDGATIGAALGDFDVPLKKPIADSGRALRLRLTFERFRRGLGVRLMQLCVHPIAVAIALVRADRTLTHPAD